MTIRLSAPMAGLVLLLAHIASDASAQSPPPTFTTIYDFTGPTGSYTHCPYASCDGSHPGSIVIGSGGVLYGITTSGGQYGNGGLFSLTPPATASGEWTETVISSNEGPGPTDLVIGTGGVLYLVSTPGWCQYSNLSVQPPPSDCGYVSSATPPAMPSGAWTFSGIFTFAAGLTPQWSNPSPDNGVAIGPNGVLYVAADNHEGWDYVFSFAPPAKPGGTWTQSDVYNFTAPEIYGQSPPVIGVGPTGLPVLYLVAYGDTLAPPYTSVPGRIVSLSPTGAGRAWAITVLYTAGPSENLSGGLAVGAEGVLYGTGGTGTSGEVFSLTPPAATGGTWTKTALYNFPPSVILEGIPTIGSGGVLYGVTASQCTPTVACDGTVFSLTPPALAGGTWTETTLHNFTGGADGGLPSSNPVIGSDGTLYGTTYEGGSAGVGTAFAIKIPAPRPLVNSGGLVSAASYAAPVAPGSIASVFGDFFVPPLSTTQSPLPASLSGLSLHFNFGPPAPLFFVSGGQVNLQVPWELAGQSQANLTATLNGQSGAAQTVNLATFAPAVFTMNAQGSGQGAILDQSNHLVDASNPATPGSTVLQIFCTGLGPVSNQPPTGSPAPLSSLAYTNTTPTVTIGGIAADVTFAGLAPGYVGLYQVNAQVPAGLAPNTAAPVVISMQGTASNTVTIAVE